MRSAREATAGRRRGQRGFTLVESAIAMGLLAFIVADVGMVTVYASRGGAEARRLTGAVSLAENAIEHARSADFNRIRLAESAAALCFTQARAAVACGDPDSRIVRECFSADLEPVACGGADAAFARERAVTPSGGAALESALAAQVDVVVTWTDGRGGGQEYHLATIVSRY